jgi:hypothetical protein
MIMSSYVLAFRGRPDRTPASGEDAAWGAWFAQLGPAVTDFGHRVGASRLIPAADAATQTGGAAASVLTGYIVITAQGWDEAARLAAGCPGLAHGVSVEVAEVVET